MGFFAKLRDIVRITVEKDPAARSSLEVVLAYPGFHVMVFYYISHRCWQWRMRLLARWISSFGRLFTGIEIHPAAVIGERLFIDHGMGVVIGSTAIIGDDVTLYQGVTLGGTSLHPGKRHPTLGNNVTVGAGAKVLGPFTIGDNALIGANAIVIKDVAPDTTMVGTLARPTSRKRGENKFWAYGMPDDLPDPVARSIEGLLEHIHTQSLRIEALEKAVGFKPSGPSIEADEDDARVADTPSK